MVYAKHFGLRENPFGRSAEPPPPYPSAELTEALNHFAYARESGEAFFLLVGEVGIGKTTAIDAILDSVGSGVRVAVVRHATLDGSDILFEILRRFGLEPRGRESKSDLLSRLERFLTQGDCEPPALLIVDEAHLLSNAALEELRLLSNLTDGDRPLMQTCLVGQPELVERLRSHELRPLRQRIAVRYVVGALSRDETAGYLAHRLREAGAERPAAIFAAEATDAIHERSGGLPREINVVANQAMLTAYATGARTVTAEHVCATANDYGFEGLYRPPHPDHAPEVETYTQPIAETTETVAEESIPTSELGEDELLLREEDDDDASSGDAPFDEAGTNSLFLEDVDRRLHPERRGMIAFAIIAVIVAAAVVASFGFGLIDRWTALPTPPTPARAPDPTAATSTSIPRPSDAFVREETPAPDDASATIPDENPPAPASPRPSAPSPEPSPPPPPESELDPVVIRVQDPVFPGSNATAGAADFVERGTTLALNGRMDDAVAAFREATQLAPRYAKAQFNLGLSLLERGRPEEAIGPLRRAVELQPDEGLTHRTLGIALARVGSNDDAASSLSTAVELRPSDALALRHLSRVLRRAGRLDDATEAAARAVAADPDDPELHHELGFTLRESGRLEDARIALEKAVELDPGLAAAHYSLGVTLLELGEPESGRRALDEAMRLGFTPR